MKRFNHENDLLTRDNAGFRKALIRSQEGEFAQKKQVMLLERKIQDMQRAFENMEAAKKNLEEFSQFFCKKSQQLIAQQLEVDDK